MASLAWVYSDVVEESGETTFNITGSGSSQFDSITFVNHLGKNDTDNSTLIKFDVVIENYNWISTNNAAKLVLVFMLKGDKSVFESSDSASASSGTISVALTDSNNGKTKTITYDHFTGSLNHDPIIGINGAISHSACLLLIVAALASLML